MKKYKKKNNLSFADFFCGCGGLSLGFEKAGFELFLANDIDRDSIDTFNHNRPNLDKEIVYCGDISDLILDRKNMLENLGCSVVVGGPPCQGFSMANRQRPINDPRNILYRRFVEAVSLIRPKIYVMENVKGMLRFASQVKDDFERVGFSSECVVLNARDYGVPQNRERILYFGVNRDFYRDGRKTVKSIITDITRKRCPNIIPLGDALWGLRKLSAKSEKYKTELESNQHGFKKDKIFNGDKTPKYVIRINKGKAPRVAFNHVARYNNERDIEIFRRLPQGGKSDHPSIADIMPYKNRSHIFKDKYYRLKIDEPCKTITSHMKFDCNMYIHPTQARGLTPREAARVQGFPDAYEFRGRFTRQYMQCGNSVPPLFAEVIAESIKNTMEDF
ncbi:DNA cytosine methyltransferase [Candidatus Omnitrophota bacterium]